MPIHIDADTFDVPMLADALPRRTAYGKTQGMIPVGEAYPNLLVDKEDYKEVIETCHREKIFPMYHQESSWAPEGFKWNQNGLPYCWAWGMAASMMDRMAIEDPNNVPMLAPVTLGWTVGWKSRGNYLESAIRGAQERGIASNAFVPNQHDRNPRSFLEGWEEDALRNRLGEVWDTDERNMIQHCITTLATGSPLYVAYNWWGHALMVNGVIWDASKPNNLIWVNRNSHNEDDVIHMTGSRAIPSEAYGVRSTKRYV